MIDRWDEQLASQCTDDRDACVYASRLLGAEQGLVLYGGGNTSVKLDAVLYVKGSGADLAQVAPEDFCGVDLARVMPLIDLSDLSNDALAAAVARCRVGHGPKPSIETLLHAVLPHRFVMHTHADSILAITNTQHGGSIAAQVFGDLAPSVPFRESGFELAKAAHAVYRERATSSTIGLILLHHGVFSFGDTARSAYANMLELVNLAEAYLESQSAWSLPQSNIAPSFEMSEIAELRRGVSLQAGFPLVLQLQDTPQLRAFARNPKAQTWWAEGPATPQHAVFVKRTPMFGRDLEAYAREYASDVARSRPQGAPEALGLDCAPRVIVDQRSGVWTAGINAHYAAMTAEIFKHDVEIMTRASAHDRYAGLPRSAILDAEINYGGFEAKVRSKFDAQTCALGEVALLASEPDATAAAIARALVHAGAEVACVGTQAVPGETLHLQSADRTPRTLLAELIRVTGGMDILIVRPGAEGWLSACLPLLRQAPRGGRIVCAGPSEWCQAVCAQIGAHSELRNEAIVLDPLPSPTQLLDIEAHIARQCAPLTRIPAIHEC